MPTNINAKALTLHWVSLILFSVIDSKLCEFYNKEIKFFWENHIGIPLNFQTAFSSIFYNSSLVVINSIFCAWGMGAGGDLQVTHPFV